MGSLSPGQPHSVGEILDNLERLAGEQAEVSIGAIVESFGQRSYGACLLVPPLIDISPVGAIPGLPTFLALALALVAAQMLVGRSHVWLPGFIVRRRVSAARLRVVTARSRGVARFLDRHFHGRLRRLTHAPFSRIAAVLVILLCCAVPPLEFLPLATTAPMAAIAAFGLALLVRDGALMIAALVLSLGAAGLGLSLWTGGGGS